MLIIGNGMSFFYAAGIIQGGTVFFMLNDFANLLSSLRKEKKISQRKAAQALEVSQALLSHYENGAREPGIAFIIRASDYYGVSVDYLLGKTDEKNIHTDPPDFSALGEASLKGAQYARMQSRIIADSITLIMNELGRLGNKQAVCAASDYLSAAVYKLSEYLCLNGRNVKDGMPDATAALIPDFCDAEMKHCEIKLKKIIYGGGSAAATGTEEAGGRAAAKLFERCELDDLNEQYPKLYPSFSKLLSDTHDKLQKK